MLLWIGFALLTAAVVAALARPLLRTVSDTQSPHAADVAVYRDQLHEIDAERERGLLDESEADAARAELGRRLLRAADETVSEQSLPAGAVASNKTPVRWTVYAAAVLIPLASLATYLRIGTPDLPGNPHSARVAQTKGEKSIEDLVGLVEQRLRSHPEDGQGWDVIAPVYMKQQRFGDAARAYANAIRLVGENAARVAGIAEALVLANNGVVVPDARSAYQRLAILDPTRPEPQFWLALAKEQDGDVAGAIGDLERMRAAAPADAPWRGLVETKIGELRVAMEGAKAVPPGAKDGKPSETSKAPPPGDVAAVEAMTPEQQSAFVAQMVDGLAKRLDQNGKDLEGWRRLVRAYKVMGRDADAAGAIAKARAAFDGDAPALEAIDNLAKSLGIGS